MRYEIKVEKLHNENIKSDYIGNPEAALDMVEYLRLEAGKFLYEYPTGFQRVIEVIRRK